MYNVKKEEISKGTFIVVRRHEPRDCLQTIKCLWLVKFLLSSHFSLLGHLPPFINKMNALGAVHKLCRLKIGDFRTHPPLPPT